MTAHLEVWTGSGPKLVPLDGERLSIGHALESDLAIEDETVSRLHAALDRFSSGWTIRDLGSRNGTYVNGERILGDRALRPGDEIRIGETRLVYRADAVPEGPAATKGTESAPLLTNRERDVLIALCRPVLGGSLLTEPATVREIAAALVVTESAVKKHLANLYDKFGLDDRRRGKLANEAVRRGAVTIADLRAAGGT